VIDPTQMNRPLTERQLQTLNIILQSIADRGFPPTMREIGHAMSIRSTNGVCDHLKALERRGYITRSPLGARSMRVLRRPGTDVVPSRLDNPHLAALRARHTALLDEAAKTMEVILVEEQRLRLERLGMNGRGTGT
jgi:SOS-response transcriptional repressor LexA